MLDLIFSSGIKSSWQIKGNKSLEEEHAKIVVLLKAFDLYVEKKQSLFDKNYRKISERYGFDIGDFYCGNFIKKRSKEEINTLLKQLAEDKIIRREYRSQMENEYSFLGKVFRHLVDYRWRLQQSIDTLTYHHITETFILYRSHSVMEQQAEMINAALLKIIGHKKPIPEKVLVKKYGYPKTEAGRLTGNKSLQEILDAL